MKSFKKALRLTVMVLVILLAAMGVGLAGGIPVLFPRKKENDPQIKIELVESRDDAIHLTQIDFKKQRT